MLLGMLAAVTGARFAAIVAGLLVSALVCCAVMLWRVRRANAVHAAYLDRGTIHLCHFEPQNALTHLPRAGPRCAREPAQCIALILCLAQAVWRCRCGCGVSRKRC